VRRFAAIFFGVVGIALLPWTIWLSASLPPQHSTRDWDIAWSGFDSALAVAFLATAFAAWRRLGWLPIAASVTGALLVADAWFDIVLESRSDERWVAVVEAFAAELPIAAVCFAVALVTSRAARRELDRA
jgi:hypothetical protein